MGDQCVELSDAIEVVQELLVAAQTFGRQAAARTKSSTFGVGTVSIDFDGGARSVVGGAGGAVLGRHIVLTVGPRWPSALAKSGCARYVQFVSTKSTEMCLDLPLYESIEFAHSPLVLVAAQINFEEVGEDVQHAQARDMQKSMPPEWTVLQNAPQFRTTLTPTGAVNEPKRSAYRLGTADGAWSLVINPDSVTLETRSYRSWDDMFEKLTTIAAAVAGVFDPAQILRVGVRYVDQVPLPDGRDSWQGLIPDSLLGAGLHPVLGQAIVGSEQRHLLQIDDQARCLVRHGMMADERQRPGGVYLLDYDVFNEHPSPFDVQKVRDVADRLHSYAGSLFRVCLTDELYAILRG
ncbi:TIGR04255 family protein [Amycolatopsis saalfeldensis]|uniref:TIGR04255 family protein n=1 Tax=Amycolatopsis saalfeldensis TaxID=394193 RepID=A0A1H8YRT5_9PSEU|nr:TIGR04255 family protein [Amycolatopsis saalfeldensis]